MDDQEEMKLADVSVPLPSCVHWTQVLQGSPYAVSLLSSITQKRYPVEDQFPWCDYPNCVPPLRVDCPWCPLRVWTSIVCSAILIGVQSTYFTLIGLSSSPLDMQSSPVFPHENSPLYSPKSATFWLPSRVQCCLPLWVQSSPVFPHDCSLRLLCPIVHELECVPETQHHVYRWLFMLPCLLPFTPTEKLLVSEDPGLYSFINQGCLSVDGMDDQEEMKLTDVCGKSWLVLVQIRQFSVSTTPHSLTNHSVYHGMLCELTPSHIRVMRFFHILYSCTSDKSQNRNRFVVNPVKFHYIIELVHYRITRMLILKSLYTHFQRCLW